MTNLLDLPEEVTEEIANSVDTYSIVAFSSTCNKLRRVANQRLSVHNAKKRRFATLAAGSFASSDWHWLEEVHPSAHLQNLVVGDRGCYASTMYIGAMGEQADCDDELDEDHILQAKQTMIQNIPQLYGSQITSTVSEISHSLYPNMGSVAQTWSDYVKAGDREATMLLLLARCPNLGTYSLELFPHISHQCLDRSTFSTTYSFLSFSFWICLMTHVRPQRSKADSRISKLHSRCTIPRRHGQHYSRIFSTR